MFGQAGRIMKSERTPMWRILMLSWCIRSSWGVAKYVMENNVWIGFKPPRTRRYIHVIGVWQGRLLTYILNEGFVWIWVTSLALTSRSTVYPGKRQRWNMTFATYFGYIIFSCNCAHLRQWILVLKRFCCWSTQLSSYRLTVCTLVQESQWWIGIVQNFKPQHHNAELWMFHPSTASWTILLLFSWVS